MKTDYEFTKSGTFKIDSNGTLIVRDSNGNELHSKNPDGGEVYYYTEGVKITIKEYDANGNLIHVKFRWT